MTLTELKNSFERRLTIENRCFHIQEDKSNNFFRHFDLLENDYIIFTIHDATNILLKPYLTSSVSSSCLPNIHIYAKPSESENSKQDRTKKSQYFLTRMATIAWDFLNISVIFYHNVIEQDKNSNS
ncbi:hypothetical protein V1478_002076 [Vespula squamosa]|uniref:Uncharacterized protein n=1 Tax=Vespula squamosa TaxID=30214 RepID=A0ABD2BYY2_VESSQ